MFKKGISASLMCLDFADTKKDLQALESAKIEYLHFDIMDGSFVPNYALGSCMVDSLRGKTGIPFDIHLMVQRPEEKIPYFKLQAGDAVSVHAESTVHLQRVLAGLKNNGVLTGAALNPATPIGMLEYVLDVLDFVLIMTVNPGYAGQKMVPMTLDKISRTREYLDGKNCGNILIQVDGNVSFENAVLMAKAGAANFVAGTAGLFRKDMSIEEGAARLRECIE
ncbi:MAG: ribulose-phosphate 3-epimerase [Eubacteriales bacterium]